MHSQDLHVWIWHCRVLGYCSTTAAAGSLRPRPPQKPSQAHRPTPTHWFWGTRQLLSPAALPSSAVLASGYRERCTTRTRETQRVAKQLTASSAHWWGNLQTGGKQAARAPKGPRGLQGVVPTHQKPQPSLPDHSMHWVPRAPWRPFVDTQRRQCPSFSCSCSSDDGGICRRAGRLRAQVRSQAGGLWNQNSSDGGRGGYGLCAAGGPGAGPVSRRVLVGPAALLPPPRQPHKAT